MPAATNGHAFDGSADAAFAALYAEQRLSRTEVAAALGRSEAAIVVDSTRSTGSAS